MRSCTGVVAPIVTRDPSFVIPEIPARPSISAFDGLNRRYVMSGTTIVPPPTTTTSAPSPNAAIASSSEDGMRISVAASTAMLATAIYPTLLGREISLASLIRSGPVWNGAAIALCVRTSTTAWIPVYASS